MNFFSICLILYVISCPFYLFQSGQPQISDYIMCLGILAFILDKKKPKLPMKKIQRNLQYFIFFVIFINAIYLLKSLFSSKISFYWPILYYVYNAIVFTIILRIYKNTNSKGFKILFYAIIVSLLLQVILGLLGISKSNYEEFRAIIFFNNPNQLGYYTLLMYTLSILLLPSLKKHKIKLLILMTFMCFYLIILSGSRAAMGGILLLFIICIFQNQLSLLKIMQFILGCCFLLFISHSLWKDSMKIAENTYESRTLRDGNRDETEIEIRGYDRLYKYPEYLIYGAGEDKFERFVEAYHQRELHSGVGTVLFCYGIAGLTLFFLFLKELIKNYPKIGILYLLPIGVYNLTHQGLRESLLWVVLAILYIVCSTHSNKIEYA